MPVLHWIPCYTGTKHVCQDSSVKTATLLVRASKMTQAERTFQARSVVVSSVLKKLVELWRPLELIPCHALYMHPTLKTNISLKRLPYWGPVFIGHLFGATQDHHLLNDYKGICFGAYAFFVLNIYIVYACVICYLLFTQKVSHCKTAYLKGYVYWLGCHKLF